MLSEYDECLTEEHGCEHVCVNTLGGFHCECNIGYELHSDGKRCEGTYLHLQFITRKALGLLPEIQNETGRDIILSRDIILNFAVVPFCH